MRSEGHSKYLVISTLSLSVHTNQATVRLEVCAEVLQHPEGLVPIMDQSECPDVWDAAGRYSGR